MELESFEDCVDEALDGLPDMFRDALENVEIVVEDWPDYYTMRLAGVHSRSGLLGFYHGIPLTERTSNYGLTPPDKISIYRRPIEMQCRSEEEVCALAKHVVEHEIADYFGIDDDRLQEIGAY